MNALPATPSPLAWKILGWAAAATIIAGAIQGFTIDTSKLWVTVILGSGLLTAAAIAHNKCKSEAAAETCMLFCYWSAMWNVLLPASYIAASFNAPLIDPVLMRMDMMLGVDWPTIQRWTDTTPWAATLFRYAYEYSLLQVIIVIFTLGATRHVLRLNTYVTGLIIATLLTLVVSALLPGTGAYPAYNIKPIVAGPIDSQINVWQSMHDFLALRAGTLRHLAGGYDGIIALPSFHTVLAVTAAWATWPIRWVGPINAALTALVLITTLPIGSHHLMDVFAGITVSAAALWLATRAEQRAGHKIPAPQHMAVLA